MIFLVMITMILLMVVTSLTSAQLEQDDGRLLRHQDQQGDELHRGGLCKAISDSDLKSKTFYSKPSLILC